MTDNNIKARVEAGMAWLDTFKPGWERSIDFATLDLRNGCLCILGQVLGEPASRFSGFAWALAHGMTNPDAFGRGFLAGSREEYDALEAEWRDAIKHRFDTGVLSDEVS